MQPHPPRAAVFLANRDARAGASGDVDEVDHVVKERVERPDGTVELTNVWRASLPIPAAIQAVVKPHMVVWTDRSIWTPSDRSCRWSLVAPFFPDHMRCGGLTRYEEAARGQATRVALDGEILIDPSGVPGLPEPMQRVVARGIEEFVCALFPLVFRKVMDAVSRQLSRDRPRA